MFSPDRFCPVCGHPAAEELHRHRHIVFEGHPLAGEYVAVVCQLCGMAFNRTAYSWENIRHYYKDFPKYVPRQELRVDAYYLEIAQILARLVPDRDSVILDVGCGGGELLVALRDIGFSRLMGVDPSPDCVAHLTRNLDIPCRVGNLDEDFLPPAICDVVLSTGVFEHLMEPVVAARRLVSLVRPSGCAFVLVPDLARYTTHLSTPFQEFSVEHINHFSHRSLANVFAPIGWVGKESGEIDRWVTPTCCYPDLWTLFEASGAPALLEIDTASADFLRDYVLASTVLLKQIDDHLRRQLVGVDRYLMWGAGQTASLLLGDTILREKQLVAVVDGNPAYAGQCLAGANILTGDVAHTACDRFGIQEIPVVVATLREATAIVNWIRNGLGWTNHIITLLPDLVETAKTS